MQFQQTQYQATVASAIGAIAKTFSALPIHHGEMFMYSPELDAELVNSGFHEVIKDEELGSVTAAMVVMEIARLPVCVEVAASTLIRPIFCPDAPRPLALVDRTDRPVRFLPQAGAALIVRDGELALLTLKQGDVSEVKSLFAYPYGNLAPSALDRAEVIPGDLAELRRAWRVGIAAEISAAIESGLALTVDYAKQRQQFGRPIGSFQAIQHRLSEIAVLSHATKWLTYNAASSGAGQDAATACAYAQDAARLIANELHQLTGAIGLTLEYSLHLWTYRLKALLSELGGAGTQSLAFADLSWGRV